MFKILLLILLSITSLNANSCVVLLYHHFDNNTPPSTSISPELFEQQLKYIKSNNFKVLSVSDLIKKIKNKEKLPKKCVILTADDAYISIYTNAYPLLKKYKIPMSVFVATDGVDKQYKILMSYKQMREISDIFSFYNHSNKHNHFYQLNTKQIINSLNTAQKKLEDKLGVKEKIFAYPYGEYNKNNYNLIKSLNYSAFGQHSGAINLSSDLARLPRFPITNTYGSMPNFITKINSLAFDIISKKPISQIVKNNPPTLQLKFRKKYKLTCFVGTQKPPNIVWQGNIVKITAQNPLKKGRTKYNCTAPSSEDNSFYWLSKQWVLK